MDREAGLPRRVLTGFTGITGIERSCAVRLVTRAFVLWAVARIVVTVGTGIIPHTGPAAPPSWYDLHPVAAAMLIGVVAFLCQTDARVMREPMFYANLGVPLHASAATGAVIALGAELLVALLP